MRKNRLIAMQFALIIALTAMTGFTYQTGGKYFEISKNLEIFTTVFKEINTHYVDELDPGTLMEKGIDAMLSSLDPYTVYYSESEIESYRFRQEGNFSGIGARIRLSGDYPVIVEVYDNGPADKAGLNAGDQIIEVDGRSTKGKNEEAMDNVLQGFSGTEVNLKVKDFLTEETSDVSVIRDELSINNVPHFELLEGNIAYANLSTFTRNAAANVRKAYRQMSGKEEDVKGYILDLRGNGGGLLHEAVELCNLFLPKNVLIVTTKSKVIDWDQSYSTAREAMDLRTPLVILVDDHSASASEIVSGTIQDYDRGVIIGQRTYGKGLVQRHRDLGYNAKMKLTISEYYIPSGRCIQAVSYDENGNPVAVPEEERNTFRTKNGRKVQDGGGVLPDLVLKKSGAGELVEHLVEELHVFHFVNQYLRNNNLTLEEPKYDFENFDSFMNFIQDRAFTSDVDLNKQLNRSLRMAEKSGDDTMVDGLKKLLEERKVRDLEMIESEKELVIREIEKEIISRFFNQKGKIVSGLRRDEEVLRAKEILLNSQRYNDILQAE
jgi:carboxyl-terminal processing protease